MGAVLVTGAQGFVGRHTVAELLRQNVEMVVGVGRSASLPSTFTHVITRYGQKRPAPLPGDLGFLLRDPRYVYRSTDAGNRAEMADLLNEFGVETIIHLASTRREAGAMDLVRGNVDGMSALLTAMTTVGSSVRRLVYGSTGGVYGVPSSLPISESAACWPIDFYASSKLVGEHLARTSCSKSRRELVVGRIFNVVGPGQEERHVCGRLASSLAAIRSGERHAVLEVRDQSVTRDYVDVRDVARALVLLAQRGEPGDIYNIGSGVQTSVSAVADLLRTAAGLSSVVDIRPVSSGDAIVPKHAADTRKLDALGLWREVPLKQSITDLMNYYLSLEPNESRSTQGCD